jgi:hypothetical protein
MNQLHITHVSKTGGSDEFWFGVYSPKEAKVAEKNHVIIDRNLRQRGRGPKQCRTAIEPWKWDTKEWGTRPLEEEDDDDA